MSYEEEIESRSGRRRRLKVELVSDDDISKNPEGHWNLISHDICSGKKCQKDISSRVNQDQENRKVSERYPNVVSCSGGKVSHQSKKEGFFAHKKNTSRKEKDTTHRSYKYHSSLILKRVQSIEAIISKIESNFKRVPPTVFHRKNNDPKDQRKNYKVLWPSKFDICAMKTKHKGIQEKHSHFEKCCIQRDFLRGHLPYYHSRKSSRTIHEIYKKYLSASPLIMKYSNIIDKIKENLRAIDHQYCSRHYQNKIHLGFDKKDKIKENLRAIDHQYCSRHYQNKIHLGFDKKDRYLNFKEDIKLILFRLPQTRNEFIQLFPVYGNSRNLDEFVEREINQNQGSNEQETFSHSLNLELVRLGSFHNFPYSSSVSTVKLARHGFYYSRREDTVICFACGFRKHDWKKDDDVETIHREASLNCPLFDSNCSNNIHIGGNGANGIDENCVSQNGGQQGITLNPDPLTDGPNNRSQVSVNNEDISRNVRDCQQNHSSNRLPSDHLTQARAHQEKINAFIRDLDPLGINFDRPKYPTYAVLAVRISSFADWPSSITQTPRDLAIAGFLYSGYGDYTRCFFCGGGLRNWEPDDDPWIEHARWFPKCAFLRQNKGDEFVALVQIEHQETEASGGMNGHQDDQQNAIVHTSRQTENSVQTLTMHPGFQSLIEMGYSSPAIQKAFDLLKETKEPIDIKAEELLEIVLAQEETTGENKYPPSASGGLENKRNIGKSEQHKSNKTPNSEDINGGSDFQTQNQRDLNSISKSLASMSVEETKSLIEENRKLKDLRLCKICLENEASIAMLPCGHLCCCPDCAPAMKKCPICRQFVKGTVKTWLV